MKEKNIESLKKIRNFLKIFSLNAIKNLIATNKENPSFVAFANINFFYYPSYFFPILIKIFINFLHYNISHLPKLSTPSPLR